MNSPNHHEIEVLEMLAGERALAWGAWVAACLEWLSDHGYASRFAPYEITAKGREFLSEQAKRKAKYD